MLASTTEDVNALQAAIPLLNMCARQRLQTLQGINTQPFIAAVAFTLARH